MLATPTNTRGTCQRCGKAKPWVMGSAFQGDGSATFRNLCARCERIEKPRNQPSLFLGVAPVYAEIEPEEIEEPEPVEVDPPQMSLWAPGEFPRQLIETR